VTELDGNRVLYRYLQRELLEADVWLFQMLTARLIVGLGVWFHPDIYARFPIMRRYAVRDPDSRGSQSRGIPDQWGSPNRAGLLRDDNSLIKRLPGSLKVAAPRNRHYNGAKMGKGFVASHVWRTLHASDALASRHPLTYSFVPNLVWLPSEVSKLTDREGAFVQQFVQALSLKIYRDVSVHREMEPIVSEAWALLPEPVAIPAEGLPSMDEMSFFLPKSRFFERRRADLMLVLSALRAVASGGEPEGKVVATRYGDGLREVSSRKLKSLAADLSRYAEAVAAAASGPP
jgi:hypothetical protein